MWICSACKNQNRANAAFCDSCGAPRPAEPGNAPVGKSWKTPLLIAGIALVLALIGLGLWLLLGRGADAPLYRVVYSKQTDFLGDVTETKYSYDGDSGRAEHYSNGQYTGYSLLRLNDRGLIESAERYYRDGMLFYISKYEYDRAGNRTLQLYYDPEGSLTTRLEIEYDDYRVATRTRHIVYQNGQETGRVEMEMSDRIHGETRRYLYGELSSTNRIERIYDGNSLVGQNDYSEDGSLMSAQSFVRDADYNVLTESIEYVYKPDWNTYTTYQWERVD